MKAKDLIKVLSEYPDFEVSMNVTSLDNSNWGFHVDHYLVDGLCDIGHSDKIIILSGIN